MLLAMLIATPALFLILTFKYGSILAGFGGIITAFLALPIVQGDYGIAYAVPLLVIGAVLILKVLVSIFGSERIPL